MYAQYDTYFYCKNQTCVLNNIAKFWDNFLIFTEIRVTGKFVDSGFE